jgi:2-oxoisovalerate dehydrogenase E1 component alpha subunit
MTGQLLDTGAAAGSAPASPEGEDSDAPPGLLAADGTLRRSPGLALDVTPALACGLYRDMVLGRRLDQEAYHLQRQGELGLWLSCRGQEAAQAGSIRALNGGDYVFPSYREQVAALCRGIGPAGLLAQWRGVAHSGWDPQAHNFHIYSLVLATQLLHATGYALGVARDRKRDPLVDDIVLVYFGDGATSQGDANEAFNWAAASNAPVIFFCQNNQWAISTPSAAQSRTPLYQRAAGFGLQSALVDGNDVLGVHAATRAAAASVRAGGPPAFIEAVTYRMAGHSTSDNPDIYREPDEVARWQARDPVARLRALLDARGWAEPGFYQALESEADALAAETRQACLALPSPRLEDTFRNTFTAEPDSLRAEREGYTSHQESFDDQPR